MKAEITKKEKAFEPIEVKITIESRKELISLIRALCSSDEDRNKDFGFEQEIELSEPDVNLSLWNKLGSKLEKLAIQ